MLGLISCSSLIGLTPQAQAKSKTLLLWYPGAAGQPEQVQPLLDTWTQYLESKGITLQAKYLNGAVATDKQHVKKLKPSLAILTLEAYLNLKSQVSMTPLALTQPLASKNGRTQYTVFFNTQAGKTGPLFLSEPLDQNFIKDYLLPQYKEQSMEYTPQALFKLKQIAQGKQTGMVLLNAQETQTVHKLNADWKNNLSTHNSAQTIPTPVVVLFDKQAVNFPKENLTQTLVAMKQDPAGKEILAQLRLLGFMATDAEKYQSSIRVAP